MKGEKSEIAQADEGIAAKTSKGLGTWLKEKRVCLLISSYQSGRLLLVGADDKGKVVLQQHKFDRAMGIGAYRGGFVFGTLHQVWRFSLINPQKKDSSELQLLLTPQNCHYTGFVNCHDVVRTKDNEILYASTLFNCVAKITETSNLHPVWVPKFIKHFVAEDRCHLNGLGLEDGKLRFVSMLGTNAQKSGWRADRSNGALFDVYANAALATGLWMPHSPRVNRGQLYALESGRGSFGAVSNGKIAQNVLLPGFTRGLDFYDTIAAIGFSRPRPESIDGLPLQERLKAAGTQPSCGAVLYDTASSKVAHSIEFTHGVDELYDVAFLQGTCNPRLIHPNSNEMLKTYSIGIPRRKLN
ncbi:MAG: TIGR03032 family protein [Aestuariivirga sp.]